MRASEFLTEYKLSVSKDADGVAVKATADGKPLGHAEFFFDEQGNLDPQTVWVDERYHGQGIARDMYDHLKGLGYTIVRSWDQTDAGRGFWDKHRGEDARVWEQRRPKLDNDAIRELNGKISMESWFGLLEAFHGYQLTESVDSSTVQAINSIVDNFSVKDPQVGQEYIPNMLIGINNKIDVYDSQGNHPAKINQPMTLTNISGPYFTFIDQYGNSKTYPEKKVGEKLCVRTVIIQDLTVFDQYRMWMQIQHKQTVPPVSGPEINENFADGKKPGRKGLSRRVGIPKKTTLAQLQKIASSSTGERRRMAQWQLNMRRGRAKKNK